MINRQQILSLSALAFTVLLFAMLGNQLANFEYFGKHLHQVLATPSIYVALALLGLGFATAAAPQKLGLSAVFWIGALVFLRAHGADLPLFAAAFKIIAYIAAGDLVLGAAQTPLNNRTAPPQPKAWQINLCVGIALTVIIASLLSVFGKLTPASIFLTETGPLVLWTAVRLKRDGPASITSLIPDRQHLAHLAPLIALVCIVAVRTNVLPQNDLDSAWYGLAIERTLAPDGSFFASPGLASPVHYYPKLAELVQYSFSSIADYSYQTCIQAVFAFLTGLLIFDWLAKAGFKAFWSVSLAALFCSAPALFHVAAGTKGDMLALLTLAIAFSALLQADRDRSAYPIGAALLALMLSAASKTLYTIFLSVPLAALSFVFVARVIKHKVHRWSSIILVSIGLTAALLITLRTYVLTGFPAVGPLGMIDAFTAIGFKPKNNTVIFEMDLAGVATESAARRIIDMLLFPYKMPHIWLTWPSMVVPILATLIALTPLPALKAAFKRNTAAALTFLYLFFAVSAFFLFGKFLVHGGDGNYYLPAGLALLAFMALIGPPAIQALNRPFCAFLIMTVMINAVLATTASWSVGLGIANWKLDATSFDTPVQQEWWLEKEGLTAIASQLSRDKSCHLLIDAKNYKNITVVLELPCSVETVSAISWSVRNVDVLTSSAARLNDYLCFSGTNFLLEYEPGQPGSGLKNPEGLDGVLTPVFVSPKWQLSAVDSAKMCGNRHP